MTRPQTAKPRKEALLLPKIGKNQSLAHQAYAALKKAIVSNVLKPTEPLREEVLAARLGISRTPLRAALKRLEFEKLIVVDASKHTFVTDVKPETMAKVLTYRYAIEPMTARTACICMSRKHLTQIEDCLRQHADNIREGNLDKIIVCELRFSSLIAAASKNEFFVDGVEMINTYMQRYIALSRTASQDVTHSLAEHAAICEALAREDPDGAETATRNHLDNIVARFGLHIPL